MGRLLKGAAALLGIAAAAEAATLGIIGIVRACTVGREDQFSA